MGSNSASYLPPSTHELSHPSSVSLGLTLCSRYDMLRYKFVKFGAAENPGLGEDMNKTEVGLVLEE